MGPIVSRPVVKPKALSCPNCGAAVEIRGFAHTLNVVCPNCLSVLDASTPELQILQKFHAKQRVQPKIALGSRGKIGGTLYEIIGFQQRTVTTEDDSFSWDEYLLFNPFKGFRYLTEYAGHWNFVRVLSALPEKAQKLGVKRRVGLNGKSFVHFDTLVAKTSFVLGEFPWQVRVNDAAQCEDFIAPPEMLSSEATNQEVTWSLATYTSGTEIWKAFQAPGSPPLPGGIFANQPSPYAGKVRPAWRTWFWLTCLLVAIMVIYTATSSNKIVFNNSYSFAPGGTGQASFVTPEFDIPGRESNIELSIQTDLRDSWAYFNLALINVQTGNAYDFGREVSYYIDSDGNEGSPNNSVKIPDVPAGRYYLRVEPEIDPKGRLMHYQLVIRRDVPTYLFFILAGVLLLIPPILKFIRAASFETARWRESDYGTSSGGD